MKSKGFVEQKKYEEMSIIEKIQDELMKSIAIKVITTPEEGKILNVGETFTVRLKLTNTNDNQVLIRSVEVESGHLAELIDSGLLKVNTLLRPHESIITPQIRMKALRVNSYVEDPDYLTVSYNIDFNPGFIFDVDQRLKHFVHTSGPEVIDEA